MQQKIIDVCLSVWPGSPCVLRSEHFVILPAVASCYSNIYLQSSSKSSTQKKKKQKKSKASPLGMALQVVACKRAQSRVVGEPVSQPGFFPLFWPRDPWGLLLPGGGSISLIHTMNPVFWGYSCLQDGPSVPEQCFPG